MKKLYAIFALAGLVTVNNTNTMLTRGLYQAGRTGRSFVQPAREALLRSGKPIITPGTFTPSRLPQGQTLGLGQRGLTTGTRQSILPRLSRQKLPTTRTIFTARPQIQPGYFQALRNPQWQQYFTNALNTLRQNPRLQALLAGLGLGGAGALSQVQQVLAEEEIKKDPAHQKHILNTYNKLKRAYATRAGKVDPDTLAYGILARKEVTDDIRDIDAHIDMFQLLQQEVPATGSLVDKLYSGKVDPVVHKRFLSLIDSGAIRPAGLLDRPLRLGRISPKILEVFKSLQLKDPEIFVRSGFKDTTKREIQRLKGGIEEIKEEMKEMLDLNPREDMSEEEDSIEDLKDQINFQKDLLDIIDPPVAGNLFGWWR